jgi:hypothetical protein
MPAGGLKEAASAKQGKGSIEKRVPLAGPNLTGALKRSRVLDVTGGNNKTAQFQATHRSEKSENGEKRWAAGDWRDGDRLRRREESWGRWRHAVVIIMIPKNSVRKAFRQPITIFVQATA